MKIFTCDICGTNVRELLDILQAFQLPGFKHTCKPCAVELEKVINPIIQKFTEEGAAQVRLAIAKYVETEQAYDVD